MPIRIFPDDTKLCQYYSMCLRIGGVRFRRLIDKFPSTRHSFPSLIGISPFSDMCWQYCWGFLHTKGFSLSLPLLLLGFTDISSGPLRICPSFGRYSQCCLVSSQMNKTSFRRLPEFLNIHGSISGILWTCPSSVGSMQHCSGMLHMKEVSCRKLLLWFSYIFHNTSKIIHISPSSVRCEQYCWECLHMKNGFLPEPFLWSLDTHNSFLRLPRILRYYHKWGRYCLAYLHRKDGPFLKIILELLYTPDSS